MRLPPAKYGLYALLALLIALPYGGFFWLHRWYEHKAEEIGQARFLVVSKEDMKLYVFDYAGKQLAAYPCACGAGYGNKCKMGDKRTPEGIFHVEEIQASSGWSHDFHDGNGSIQGAYGPYFIRLYVPGQSGIGIHGTHDPNSLGSRATEGCIRLENKNVRQLVGYVKSGTVVVITPSSLDMEADTTGLTAKPTSGLTPQPPLPRRVGERHLVKRKKDCKGTSHIPLSKGERSGERPKNKKL
ncbi:MAG: L,D-transpeptidase [Tannerella sp.]|jgi:hypothetical protein|nr:L,D-transpeptidase [Tannerella sp.]